VWSDSGWHKKEQGRESKSNKRVGFSKRYQEWKTLTRKIRIIESARTILQSLKQQTDLRPLLGCFGPIRWMQLLDAGKTTQDRYHNSESLLLQT